MPAHHFDLSTLIGQAELTCVEREARIADALVRVLDIAAAELRQTHVLMPPMVEAMLRALLEARQRGDDRPHDDRYVLRGLVPALREALRYDVEPPRVAREGPHTCWYLSDRMRPAAAALVIAAGELAVAQEAIRLLRDLRGPSPEEAQLMAKGRSR